MPEPDEPRPCCECGANAGIARHFDAKVRESLAACQAPGLVAVSERLRDALLAAGPTGKTVLELGCGRGGLLRQLLDAGAASATGLDLSEASIEDARRRFAEAGLADRVRLRVGDAAYAPVKSHDWVILDRVICCYPDVERLLANSIPAARQLYAFTVPPSRGWRGRLARILWGAERVLDRLRRDSCRGYVHDVGLVERRLRDAGFRLRHQENHRLWHVAVYERPGVSAVAG